MASCLPATLVTSSAATSAEMTLSRSGSCSGAVASAIGGAGQLALLDQAVDDVLAEHRGEDRVADPRVVEVVAAQVRDAGDHPALDQRQPGDVGRDGERDRDQAAEVGDEPLRRRRSGRGSRSPRGRPCRRRPSARASWASAALPAGGSGPTPTIARCSASRTNDVVSPGASSPIRGASCLLTAAPCSHLMLGLRPCVVTDAGTCGCRSSPRRPRGSSRTRARRRGRPGRRRRRPRSRAPCSRPTGAGSSRCPSTASGRRCTGSRPVRRGHRAAGRAGRVAVAAPVAVATSRSGSTPRSTRWSPAAPTRRATPGWITRDIAAAYGELHRLGWAHSVEAWRDGELAGGLYGVGIGGLFAGESMFHRVRDASKVALVGLVELLRDEHADGRLLDVQWVTPHLATPRRGRGAARGVPRAARAGPAPAGPAWQGGAP